MVLKDKVAVVTGASSGMGYVIAAEFAKQGAKVLAVARRAERLENLVKETQEYPGKVEAFAADLSDMEHAEKIIDEAVARFGRIDILINNAGIMDDFSPVGQFKNDMLDKLMKVNVYAPFYSSRKALEYFEKQGSGNIINIASVAGLYGGRGGAAYVASKHAVVGLTKNTAYHYKDKNIRCNAICPGGIETEVGAGEFMKNVNMEAMQHMYKGLGTMPRQGQSEEIASVALFLVSDGASYINGQAIAVDGGWTSY